MSLSAPVSITSLSPIRLASKSACAAASIRCVATRRLVLAVLHDEAWCKTWLDKAWEGIWWTSCGPSLVLLNESLRQGYALDFALKASLAGLLSMRLLCRGTVPLRSDDLAMAAPLQPRTTQKAKLAVKRPLADLLSVHRRRMLLRHNSTARQFWFCARHRAEGFRRCSSARIKLD
eukprot:358514-Chlamydomonas_euryale.AAC.3